MGKEAMAVFTEEEWDWQRLDFAALITGRGIICVELAYRAVWSEWLRGKGYSIESFDCSAGMASTVDALTTRLRWQEYFGYTPESGEVNLSALDDGFEFEVAEEGGLVLELLRPDLLWEADAQWTMGLLSIIQKHSQFHLAFGRRFFAVCIVPYPSPFVGQIIDRTSVPSPKNKGPLPRLQ